MSGKTKIILGVILGVIGAIALFCLIVVIGCSVNGLKFGEQVCAWFQGAQPVIDGAEAVVESQAITPIV